MVQGNLAEAMLQRHQSFEVMSWCGFCLASFESDQCPESQGHMSAAQLVTSLDFRLSRLSRLAVLCTGEFWTCRAAVWPLNASLPSKSNPVAVSIFKAWPIFLEFRYGARPWSPRPQDIALLATISSAIFTCNTSNWLDNWKFCMIIQLLWQLIFGRGKLFTLTLKASTSDLRILLSVTAVVNCWLASESSLNRVAFSPLSCSTWLWGNNTSMVTTSP